MQELYYGPGRGISLPPLLIDINSDGTEDIIVAIFNSTIMAINGLTFKEIWSFTIADSEVISIPIPGYYNDDNVPDFMVKHQIGSGFPVYYYTTATVLDGKTGKPLLEKPMEDSMSRQMSGISITVDGYGNDWFVHWSANCFNKEGAKDKFQFLKDSEENDDFSKLRLLEQENADLCKLRFNSSLTTSLLAFSQHVEPPGLPLYQSKQWENVEFNNSVDSIKEADDYFLSHSYRNVPLDNTDKKNEVFQKSSQNEEVLSESLGRNDRWKNENPQENTYDDYEDNKSFDDEERLESRQLSEIQRLQRSEKHGGRYINNDTNDVQNQLDPSMDYTNGQSKLNNYYTTLNFNRTSNSEDNSDYMNLPDIDFVDNIKEAEALSSKRKREVSVKSSSLQENKIYKRAQANSKKSKYQISLSKSANHNHKKKLLNKPEKRKIVKREDNRLPKKSNGLQRQPPTGLLLPSLKSEKKNSVDLIFSTYWLPSSSIPFVILPQDLECMEKIKSQSSSKLSTDDTILAECLRSRGINYQFYEEAMDKENVKIPLGQMTLYRMQLQCMCPEDLLPGQTCKEISKQQSWSQYLGTTGNGYFTPIQA